MTLVPVPLSNSRRNRLSRRSLIFPVANAASIAYRPSLPCAAA